LADDRGGSYDGGRDGYSSGYDRDDRDGHDGYRDRDDREKYDRSRHHREGHDGDDRSRHHRDGHDGYRDRDDDTRGRGHEKRSHGRYDDSRPDRSDRFGWEKRDLSDGDHKDARHREHQDKDRAGHKYGHEVAFMHQQRSMLAHLTRAEAFLDALSNRIAESDLDPGLKSTLLDLIAERRATVVDLITQVQAARTLQDLREIRPEAFNPTGGTSAPTS
jgi:hypothetical protein